MTAIIDIHAREILDSRGKPTVEVDVILESGVMGRASVPSGASTGGYEAVELRDGDNSRYRGMGVRKAVQAIENEIFPALSGIAANEQNVIDNILIQLDGTENKERLGSNSILAVSLGVAKAAAQESKQPLYRYIGGVQANLIPVPMMNILNGGVHADNNIDIQEFMILPISAQSFAEAMQTGSEIFSALKIRLSDLGLNTNVGDEGGFAPNLKNTVASLDILMKAIENAGYRCGEDVVLALDVAANELFDGNIYNLPGEKRQFSSEELIKFYDDLIANYPIVSIEDGLSEDDWDGWTDMTDALGRKVLIVGDDLFVTNSNRLSQGIKANAANSILIKLNQIGT